MSDYNVFHIVQWHVTGGPWTLETMWITKHVPALYNFFVRKGEHSAVQHTLIMVTVSAWCITACAGIMQVCG